MMVAPAILKPLEQSVQSFPPTDSIGVGMFNLTQRGKHLAAFGTRYRDRQLRDLKRHEHNWLWQSATGGFIKKIQALPYKITGPDNLVSQVKDMFLYAHFGAGLAHWINLVLDDLLNQDFGAIVEIIGPGDPMSPLTGMVTGIAHLDSLRCYATGNPIYPIVYYSSWSGKMHKMHYTRVYRWVENPDPDEQAFGSGLSPLSRAASITMQQIYMNRYVEQSLDDKPPPGVAVAKGMTEALRNQYVALYNREQSSDQLPVWGQTMWFYDLDGKLDIDFKSYSTPPEKFDYERYTNIHVNAIAAALGVDKQELWELTGQGLGTGTQSQVLAQKSKGKLFGAVVAGFERMLNNYILPPDVEFKFEFKDEEQDQAQAEIDRAYSEIANTMKLSGLFSDLEIRQMLADRSETYRKVLTNQSGQVTAFDDDIPATSNDVTVGANTATADESPSENPLNLLATNVAVRSSNPLDRDGDGILNEGKKDFNRTRSEFERYFVGTVRNARSQLGKPRNLEISLRSRLRELGEQAYLDGKRKGGDTSQIDDDERVEITRWLAGQDGYIRQFAAEVFDTKMSEPMIAARAAMWSNKSLQQIYSAGIVSSGKNKRFKWRLGKTEKHCDTCQRLNGQVHKYKEWYSRRLLPKSDKLSCGGWLCDCRLEPTNEPSQGRF